ncbi:hypothetical protein BXZ70DRAFT_304341 [Cristinia sonorae]|uniref:Uncharacterized protein n=1 Tax=Cristinia sonorae TaxID=1940300 RepID=A0A8K0UMX5_9AGAR|nr:hypothetical protein BXZ70DRAFT_304341 [Cristinia sonorae]
MSQDPITSQRHNEYVGSDSNAGRIPGAENASTGHHFISVFPKEGAPKQSNAERRPEEHLPPPTGRDLPPKGITPDATLQPQQHYQQQSQQPLAPAPDSRTVIDKDPFAERTSVADTMTGATSKDVYGGIGKPGSGMSSAEMHHDGAQHRKRTMQGLDQYGNAGEVFGEQDAENMRKR